MEVFEAIKRRRSIREYKSKPIPSEAVDKLIEALLWAPSAGNLQSRKFYFVFNQEHQNKLAKAALNQSFLAEAPLVVVGCADKKISRRYGKRGEEVYAVCDVSASLQNMMLLAKNLGLGTVWIGAFDENSVAQILGLPDNLEPIALVPVGYPDREPSPPPRKKKEEVIVKVE